MTQNLQCEKSSERLQALTDLIMEKFDQDSMVFYQWAVKIHEEVIETLPETTELVEQRKIVKILEWDPGKYLGLLNEYKNTSQILLIF